MANHRKKHRGGTTDIPGSPIATSVVITSIVSSIKVGDALTLTAEFHGTTGIVTTGYVLFWESLDDTIATIDASTGEVTTVGAIGNVTFSVRDEGNTLLPATITVQVTNPFATVGSVSVQLNPTTVVAGNGGTITALVLDTNGQAMTGRTVTYAEASSHITIAADTVVEPNHTTTYSADGTTPDGSVDITVTDTDSGINTIVTLSTLATGGGVAPDIDQYFNYADDATFKGATAQYIAGVRHGWEDLNGVPNVGGGNHFDHISLDATHFDSGAPAGAKSMRMHYTDRIGEGAPVWNGTTFSPKGYCGDYTISRNWRYATPQLESWVEIDVELSANFTVICQECVPPITGAPPNASPSTAGLKFFFPCLMVSPQTGRHDSYIDDGTMRFGFPSYSMPSGTYLHGVNTFVPGGPRLSVLVATGSNGFKVRYHNKINQTFNYPATVYAGPTTVRGASANNTLLLEAGTTGVAIGHYVTVTNGSGYISCTEVASVSGLGGATPSVTFKNPTSIGFPIDAAAVYRLSTTPVYGNGICGMEVFIGGVSQGRHVYTNLVDGTAYFSPIPSGYQASKIYHTAAGQKSSGPSFDRNMNQGPVGHEQDLWYRRYQDWFTDPGWGW